jgi:DNA repair protein RadC
LLLSAPSASAKVDVDNKVIAESLRLLHNHPSGDPSPSKQDIAATRDVVEAGKRLGIQVHDHVIIGANGHSSMRAQGLL